MIVQRKGSREFANVGQVAAAAREVLGGNPRVVEFADMDMDEQVGGWVGGHGQKGDWDCTAGPRA
jgi:hypothetical protein